MLNDSIREKVLKKIRPLYEAVDIKVLTGIRGTGKTKLIESIIYELKDKNVSQNSIIYLDLEESNLNDYVNSSNLLEQISKKPKTNGLIYIFLDNAQRLISLSSSLKTLKDRYHCSIFLALNCPALSISTSRQLKDFPYKEFNLSSLSFVEAVELNQKNGVAFASPREALLDYLMWGGLPGRFIQGSESEKTNYLLTLGHDILERDLFSNRKRTNYRAFEGITKYLLNHSGETFSALSLAKYLTGVDDPSNRSESVTINRYARGLVELGFLQECRPYYLQGQQRSNGSSKLYAADAGLRQPLEEKNTDVMAQNLKEAIFHELLSQDYEVYYGRYRNLETDFVLVKGSKKCLIDVVYSLEKEKDQNSVYENFKRIHDCSPKYVISMDEKDTSQAGITHYYALDFFLRKTSFTLL